MPENTLAAFISAKKLGVDILEMDARLSKDNQIVLIHDKNLERVSNCNGLVSDYTYAVLSKCKVVVKNGSNDPHPSEIEEFVGKNKIALMQDVFKMFNQHRMIIEIKDNSTQLSELLCTLIQQYKKTNSVLVGSFHQNAMEHFRNSCPNVATAATFREAAPFVLLSKLNLSHLLSINANALLLPVRPSRKNSFRFFFKIITKSLIKQAHKQNIIVQAWTINDPESMQEMIDLGVDGIMTDYPDRLMEVLKNRIK